MIWALRSAIDFQSARMPEATLEQVGELLVKAYFAHKTTEGKFAVKPQKFYEQGLYQSAEPSTAVRANILVDNPATRALAQMEGD